MTPTDRNRAGWTLVEMLVATIIVSLLLSMVLVISRSVTQQGEAQDKTTTTWTIAGNALSLLRNDVMNAVALRRISAQRLELDVLSIDKDFAQKRQTVVWEQKDAHTIIRTEGSARQEHSFARSLHRGESIQLGFALAP